MGNNVQILSRPFGRPDDFEKVTQFVQAVALASTNSTQHIHAGDIAWRFFRSAQFDPKATVQLWEEQENGTVVGLGWYSAAHHGLDMIMLPDMRDCGLDKRILRWGDQRFRSIPFKDRGYAQLKVQVLDWDTERMTLLSEAGFRQDMFHYVWYQHQLEEKIEVPILPDGYEIRKASDLDVAARAKLHNKAFFSGDVSAESYSKLMRTDIYQRSALDFVAVAPNGRLSAFALGWLDTERKIGIFEPVGTHPKRRQLGLAKALLTRTMQEMQAAGMRAAQVYTESPNQPAQRLYRSVGFELLGKQFDWLKRPA